MPLSFDWALVLLLACLVAATLMLERCLAALFGVRWLHVAAAALLLVSFIHTPSLVWFASGLQGCRRSCWS